jgi:1-acyl-sn-glycerol-3-phosphate acyltransferase
LLGQRPFPESNVIKPDTMVLVLRSLAFQLFFYLWTAAVCLLPLPLLPFLSAASTRAIARFWERGTLAALRLLVGLSYEVRGRERLPEGPALLAAKHQSAWETLTFHVIVPDLAIGLKDELTRIPVFGWYLMRADNIRIDRGAAARAIRSLIAGAKKAVGRGQSVLIFPEGTRMAPGEAPDYKPGVAALYAALDLPAVPIALNSGVFWRRREFVKRPGRIVVEFLEPIPPGLDRKTFMRRLEQSIETATAALVAEARGHESGQSVGRSV